MAWTLQNCREDGGDMAITCTRRTGWPWNRRVEARTWIGNGTVWHDEETGRRPSTLVESWLAEIEWLARRGDRSSV